MEPSRILSERGEAFDIFYSNSNIAPQSEYEHRLETLEEWASNQGYTVIEGNYDHDDWAKLCKIPFEEGQITREERCRRCYRIRFEEAVGFAKDNGYEAVSTTLSVSPYQYTDAICEELERACEIEGLECAFEDFRPYYDEATRRSREAGMYRQNYCGCELSALEAKQEREERRNARKLERERKRLENAEEDARKEAELRKHREERKAYDDERARRRSILKRMREERKAAER